MFFCFLFFKFKIEKKRIEKSKKQYTKYKKEKNVRWWVGKPEILKKKRWLRLFKNKNLIENLGLEKFEKQTIIKHNEELSFNIRASNKSNLFGLSNQALRFDVSRYFFFKSVSNNLLFYFLFFGLKFLTPFNSFKLSPTYKHSHQLFTRYLF